MQDSLLDRIYDATEKGLQIILYYYPQAMGCDKPGKKFKARPDEKTASACLKLIKDKWMMTDFGDEGRAISPIDICMREERIEFNEALQILAERYNVGRRLNAQINKAEWKERDAKPEEKEGDFKYEVKEEMSEEELKVLGPMVKKETVKKYNYYSLAWYEIVKNRKVKRVISNENYPIFMHDCGEFKKIYSPLNPDKAYRFFYKGNKPKDYINGMDELKAAYEKYIKEVEEEENASYDESKTPDTSKEKKIKKLPEAILCSGERDALNIAGMGYLPLWMNSETAHLEKKQYEEIMKKVERLYNIPDMDKTGVRKGMELAMEYVDIYTVELPKWLEKYKDMRGRPRKDVRDFVEIQPSIYEFKQLLKMAKPCRFWEKNMREKGKYSIEINTLYLLNFLKANGYWKITDEENDKITYISISGYKIKETTTTAINNFIINWAKENKLDHEIQNAILNSKRVGQSTYEKIEEIKPNFKNNSVDSQTLFFKNTAITVTAEEVKEYRNGKEGTYAWDKSICKHDFKRLEPAFKTETTQSGNTILEITNTKSHYFRFLINSSRIYWKKEFEERIENDEQKNKEWILKNHWAIGSDRLTAEEMEEQQAHLLNKMYVIGYLMHSYKSFAKALGIWVMENKITEEEESSGGSGKTFMLRFLNNFKSMEMVNGRDKKLTENQFFLDRVTENTDLLLIDDATKYFNFNYFYSMLTDNMVVNYKNAKSKEISFKDSPKIIITSNFPPPANDGSTARRILNCVFSDYYHKATEDNGYMETMRIADDFGYELYNEKYSWEWWNEDYNFCIDCLQFYLKCNKENRIMEPPMNNVNKRMKLQTMGDEFKQWADIYFAQDGGNCDRLINKTELKDIFDPKKKYTTKGFTTRLKAWCAVTEYVEEYNPRGIKGMTAEGRIIMKINGQSCEMIYIKTNGKELNLMI